MLQQVLAVDLLNPTPQAEARKHKLKVRLRCISFMAVMLREGIVCDEIGEEVGREERRGGLRVCVRA